MKTIDLPQRGLRLAYDDVGTGLPVVLLHAFPFDREMWSPQHGPLSVLDVRVLAPDFPGFGRSTAGSDPFTIEGAADVVADFLAALNVERAVIGGLSMGGYVAMAFARKYPERVTALVLADTRPAPDDQQARENRDKAIAAVKADGAAKFAEGMIPKLLCESTTKNQPQVVEFVRKVATRQPAPAVIAALEALRDRPDATPGLASFTRPTLVLVGEFDAVTPPLSAARLAAHVAGSELAHIPDAGHLSNVENPDAFNAAVAKFLKKVL
ncbi:alpha beta hydrolase : Alpha/beta hydrolase fold OS=Rubrobacter xylanophilus (strain DSM 9941 / NBRC 16129) GN=Rxyl_0135 PE=4 SV=1: Abhydrolase_6 [Gemmataceae bacterium]|nr:alpha beta hydrolase : Alpha/beta hydrolase fold OS=Rubrobacter xylanophilus (strain DSM 9941 / NBRC 16129) GN=Rxyl_0135 PE=4 SV=1: Abhydrolase_6 [Gemmataceae bacterium]VTU01885.1 alpha beta hydrolase : Alpha/beta hydrolase fold OS=Rubrobacter xylanophilus (strain DSM 9941 / NBRC 16129) GN=Rxyl_0135 PE=4 SV=1: Abhydrolase_6 [Gemmataceae bacterium]